MEDTAKIIKQVEVMKAAGKDDEAIEDFLNLYGISWRRPETVDDAETTLISKKKQLKEGLTRLLPGLLNQIPEIKLMEAGEEKSKELTLLIKSCPNDMKTDKISSVEELENALIAWKDEKTKYLEGINAIQAELEKAENSTEDIDAEKLKILQKHKQIDEGQKLEAVLQHDYIKETQANRFIEAEAYDNDRNFTEKAALILLETTGVLEKALTTHILTPPQFESVDDSQILKNIPASSIVFSMIRVPIAEHLRPTTLDEVVGQEHLLGNEGVLSHVIKGKKPLSIILWGPPGCGKTSIARLYAKAFALPFRSISAVFSGVSDIRRVIQETEDNPLQCRSILLFVDEIHRFNKAQQDAFLPFIENGTLVLVGATAENPSFYLNSALLSRLRVLKLNHLTDEALEKLIDKYREKVQPIQLTASARELLVRLAQGDGRYLFNLMEHLAPVAGQQEIAPEDIESLLPKRAALFDKKNDQHYNLISALHKSVRGSDPNAALYWFARMLEGGEDPLFLARRLIRMASEDIGLADPHALPLAVAAREAFATMGAPEGELALAEVVVYLALAPKSNSIETALIQARKSAQETSHLDPPAIILNAPTTMMKNLGYGNGYQYDHNTPLGFSGQNYFPDGMDRETFYKPVERGFEREMIKRTAYFNKLRTDLSH